MKSAFEIKAIFHDIKATGIEVNLQLTTFIKVLHPFYSHYLECLQASRQLKDITFDELVNKIAKREKVFRKKEDPPNSNVETLCLAQKDQKSHAGTSRGDKSSRGHGRRNYRGRGEKIIREPKNKMIGNKGILMIDHLSNVLDVVKLVILLLTVKYLGRK